VGDGQREEGRSSLSFNAWIAIAVGLLVVIVLSLHVPVLLRYRQEQKAVAAIARLGKGATCTIAGCAPPWPMSVLAHKWKPYGRLFDRAVRAELGYPATATNADVALLAGLTELQELDLGDVCYTDAGLVHLAGLTKLQTLRLTRARQVTDAGLVHLAGLTKLQTLRLTCARQVTDAGLVHHRDTETRRTAGAWGRQRHPTRMTRVDRIRERLSILNILCILLHPC
jgi:hypothetical protein